MQFEQDCAPQTRSDICAYHPRAFSNSVSFCSDLREPPLRRQRAWRILSRYWDALKIAHHTRCLRSWRRESPTRPDPRADDFSRTSLILFVLRFALLCRPISKHATRNAQHDGGGPEVLGINVKLVSMYSYLPLPVPSPSLREITIPQKSWHNDS